MASIRCPQCSHDIQHEALERPPPWCPKCGADFRPPRTAAPAAPAPADPNAPPQPGVDAALPAAAPEESLQDALERMALARYSQPRQGRRGRHAGLLVFVALIVAVAVFVAMSQP